MKFIVNNETLQTDLALLSSVAGGKGNAIPVLQNILIESIDDSSLRLTSSDLDVTLYCQAEARVTEPGKILLPLAKLLAITKTLPKTADLNFKSLDNGGANLTLDRAAFKLLGPDVIHAHDPHGVAMASLALSMSSSAAAKGGKLPVLIASRRVDFHLRGN